MLLLSTESDPVMLLGYVARTATRPGQIAQDVLELFPDYAIPHDFERVASALAERTTAPRAYASAPAVARPWLVNAS